MIYSQVLWALALDRIVWNVRLNFWDMIGVVSVIGSLSLVSLVKEVTTSRMVDGTQYGRILHGTNESTSDIDPEILRGSDDRVETIMYDPSHSQ